MLDIETQTRWTQLPSLTELAVCGTDRQLFGNLMSIVQGEVPRAVDDRTETFSVGESKKASLRRWLRNWDQKDLWNINEDTWQLTSLPMGGSQCCQLPTFPSKKLPPGTARSSHQSSAASHPPDDSKTNRQRNKLRTIFNTKKLMGERKPRVWSWVSTEVSWFGFCKVNSHTLLPSSQCCVCPRSITLPFSFDSLRKTVSYETGAL